MNRLLLSGALTALFLIGQTQPILAQFVKEDSLKTPSMRLTVLADGLILDLTASWFTLNKYLIDNFVPQARILHFNH